MFAVPNPGLSGLNYPRPESLILVAEGAPDRVIGDRELADLMNGAFDKLGRRSNVLLVPPDDTRPDAHARFLVERSFAYYADSITAVMPALGTHTEMKPERIRKFFGPHVPAGLFLPHKWETEIERAGTIPADTVARVTGGLYNREYPIHLNRRLLDGTHDLILATSHIIPHEVMGFAGKSKQLIIGLGGKDTIDPVHEIAALYGIDRTLGVMNTPSRQLIRMADEIFLADKNVVYVMLVRSPAGESETPDSHGMVTRGVFIGNGDELFKQAVKLSREVNITVVESPLERAVVYLPPENYHSFWLGMKGSYRMRLAMDAGGELFIVCPGVTDFGERASQTEVIKKYGYCGMSKLLELRDTDPFLQQNTGTWAHLTHGSPPELAPGQPKFKQYVCPGTENGLSADDVRAVNFEWHHPDAVMARFGLSPESKVGFYGTGENRVYFAGNPAKGLWLSKEAFAALDLI